MALLHFLAETAELVFVKNLRVRLPRRAVSYVITWKEMKAASPRPGLREHLRHVSLSLLSIGSRPAPGSSLRLLYLHNVFADQIPQFERQLRYLLGIGTFITAGHVLDVIRGQKALDGRLFHLSFDDGFRNVITNALPVLVTHGIPATFFVPTARISADYATAAEYDRISAYFPRVLELATWDDLGRAQELGLEIASHTRTHARLSDITKSADQLQSEILGSKEDIERELGTTCSYLSWPFGTPRDADPESLKAVECAGYDGCFGGYRGRVVPKETDRFSIPRHHFEADWPLSHLKYFSHGAREGTR